MFEALVVVCSILNPSQCVILDDSLGPYLTKDECIARVEEIVDIAPGVFEEAYPDAIGVIELTAYCTPDSTSGPEINI